MQHGWAEQPLTVAELNTLRVEQLRSCLRVVGLRTTYKLKAELGERLLGYIIAHPQQPESHQAAQMASSFLDINKAKEESSSLQAKSKPQPKKTQHGAHKQHQPEGLAGRVTKKKQEQRSSAGRSNSNSSAGATFAVEALLQLQQGVHPGGQGTDSLPSAQLQLPQPNPEHQQQPRQHQHQQATMTFSGLIAQLSSMQQQQQQQEQEAPAVNNASPFVSTPPLSSQRQQKQQPPDARMLQGGLAAHESNDSTPAVPFPEYFRTTAAASTLPNAGANCMLNQQQQPAAAASPLDVDSNSSPAAARAEAAGAAASAVALQPSTAATAASNPAFADPAFRAFMMGSPAISHAVCQYTTSGGLLFRCPCARSSDDLSATGIRATPPSTTTTTSGYEQQQQEQAGNIIHCCVCGVSQHRACCLGSYCCSSTTSIATMRPQQQLSASPHIEGTAPAATQQESSISSQQDVSGHLCEICRLVAVAAVHGWQLQWPLLVGPRLLEAPGVPVTLPTTAHAPAAAAAAAAGVRDRVAAAEAPAGALHHDTDTASADLNPAEPYKKQKQQQQSAPPPMIQLFSGSFWMPQDHEVLLEKATAAGATAGASPPTPPEASSGRMTADKAPQPEVTALIAAGAAGAHPGPPLASASTSSAGLQQQQVQQQQQLPSVVCDVVVGCLPVGPGFTMLSSGSGSSSITSQPVASSGSSKSSPQQGSSAELVWPDRSSLMVNGQSIRVSHASSSFSAAATGSTATAPAAAAGFGSVMGPQGGAAPVSIAAAVRAGGNELVLACSDPGRFVMFVATVWHPRIADTAAASNVQTAKLPSPGVDASAGSAGAAAAAASGDGGAAATAAGAMHNALQLPAAPGSSVPAPPNSSLPEQQQQQQELWQNQQQQQQQTQQSGSFGFHGPDAAWSDRNQPDTPDLANNSSKKMMAPGTTGSRAEAAAAIAEATATAQAAAAAYRKELRDGHQAAANSSDVVSKAEFELLAAALGDAAATVDRGDALLAALAAAGGGKSISCSGRQVEAAGVSALPQHLQQQQGQQGAATASAGGPPAAAPPPPAAAGGSSMGSGTGQRQQQQLFGGPMHGTATPTAAAGLGLDDPSMAADSTDSFLNIVATTPFAQLQQAARAGAATPVSSQLLLHQRHQGLLDQLAHGSACRGDVAAGQAALAAAMAGQPTVSTPMQQQPSHNSTDSEDATMNDMSRQMYSLSLLDPSPSQERAGEMLFQQLIGSDEGFWSPRGMNMGRLHSVGSFTPRARRAAAMDTAHAALLETPPPNAVFGVAQTANLMAFSPFWQPPEQGVAASSMEPLPSLVSPSPQPPQQQYLPLMLLHGRKEDKDASRFQQQGGQQGSAQQPSGAYNSAMQLSNAPCGPSPPAAATSGRFGQQQQKGGGSSSATGMLFSDPAMEVEGPNLISTGGVLSGGLISMGCSMEGASQPWWAHSGGVMRDQPGGAGPGSRGQAGQAGSQAGGQSGAVHGSVGGAGRRAGGTGRTTAIAAAAATAAAFAKEQSGPEDNRYVQDL